MTDINNSDLNFAIIGCGRIANRHAEHINNTNGCNLVATCDIISDKAEVAYKTTDYWEKDCERSIIWDDKDINIKWPALDISTSIILSDKDKKGKKLCELKGEDLF